MLARRLSEMPAPPPLAPFLAAVRGALAAGTFESVVLSKPRDGHSDLKGIRVRRIGLRSEPALSFVLSHATRDVTRNHGIDDGIATLATWLDAGSAAAFAHATLHADDGDVQLMISKKGQHTLRSLARAGAPVAADDDDGDEVHDTASSMPPLAAHDRVRERRLPLELPFLVELGITDASHRLVPSMARKWRQIDKFLEVLDSALDALPAAPGAAGATPRPLRVVDFGAGKGYLTFAVHEHLRRRFGAAPEVTGVELRAELVDFGNAVAQRCGASGLRFVAGDLRSFVPERVDIMIALHACDTATDHAIDLGLVAGASVLVCSPCCHKELRPQMTRPGALAGVLRHGVHFGQEAEMVTDSLRALLLEAAGYDARVFEFVTLEHTRKNKMILATRRDGRSGEPEQALAQVKELKDFYGIREQCLEQLLKKRVMSKASLGQAEGSA